VHHRRYRTRAEARADIFHYIEVWYNRKHRHSSLGYLSPVNYEIQRAEQQLAMAA
jgi:putative transposase